MYAAKVSESIHTYFRTRIEMDGRIMVPTNTNSDEMYPRLAQSAIEQKNEKGITPYGKK